MQLQACLSCLFLLCASLIELPGAYSAEKSPAENLFGQLDVNDDGRLTADEVQAEHARLFSRLLRTADYDGDEELSGVEFADGLKPQRIAKPLTEKPRGEFPGADALLLLLARMDTNGDQSIEADEVPKDLKGFFKQVQNRVGGEADDRISKRELVQAAPRLSQMALRFTELRDIDVEVELALLSEKKWAMVQRLEGPNRPGEMLSDPKEAREIFAQLDADGNGQVEADEVPPAFATQFERLLERADENHDGQLSQKELLAVSHKLARFEKNRLPPREVKKFVDRLLNQLDQNGDKLLSRKEAPRRMADRFDRVDADGNGNLDRQELTLVVELLNQLRLPEGKGFRQKPKVRKLQP